MSKIVNFCAVPGCQSKLFAQNVPKKRNNHQIEFFKFPTNYDNFGVLHPLKQIRRLQWIKALRCNRFCESTINNFTVCSRHFESGRPANDDCPNDRDWVPSLNMLPQVYDCKSDDSQRYIQQLIGNLPTVADNFDKPEYILLDQNFNEREIEQRLIDKYIQKSVCDVNGSYKLDHDYLSPSVVSQKTDSSADHSYSISKRPACSTIDSKNFCNICSLDCENLFDFNNHMATHTIHNKVQCKFCSERFLTTTCLNNHLLTHLYTCNACGYDVPVTQLKAHKWANRKQKNKNRNIARFRIPQNKKIYFCIFCVKNLQNETEYRNHMCQHKKGAGKIIKKL